MKITLIDGTPESIEHKNYTRELAIELTEAGHRVTLYKTSAMKINFCIGCWSCWWKTPGVCPQHDDMPNIYRSYLDSDLVIHFSPMIAGFVSSSLKTVNDRSVPLVHPYIRIVNNECHHLARYDKYPAMALIVDPLDSDDEDLEITKDLYQRLALNLKSELIFFTTTHNNREELIDAINHI